MSQLPLSLRTPRSQSFKNKFGFTMIEVVLVLAIAGLIFMGIFVALPNAQMNQRNANRRADYTRLASNISNFASDNNGRLPKLANIKQKWLNESGEDPDGNPYPADGAYKGCDYNAASCTAPVDSAPTGSDQVHIYFGYICDRDGKPTTTGASSRTFAIYGYMENGSDGDTYCHQSNG